MTNVFLVLDDRNDDRDDGLRWAVGIYFVDDSSEVQERVYSNIQRLAFEDAKALARMNGWNVVDGPEGFTIP